MKKVFTFLMMISMIFSLTACGNKTAGDSLSAAVRLLPKPEHLNRKQPENQMTARLNRPRQPQLIRPLRMAMTL